VLRISVFYNSRKREWSRFSSLRYEFHWNKFLSYFFIWSRLFFSLSYILRASFSHIPLYLFSLLIFIIKRERHFYIIHVLLSLRVVLLLSMPGTLRRKIFSDRHFGYRSFSSRASLYESTCARKGRHDSVIAGGKKPYFLRVSHLHAAEPYSYDSLAC